MIKLICLDYTGAILQQKGDELKRLIAAITDNSILKDSERAAEWLQNAWDEIEHNHDDESHLSLETMISRLFDKGEREIQLRADQNELKMLVSSYMMYGPIGPDVKEFIRLCPLPVYITSMNSAQYVNVCMRRNGLHVNRVISAEKTNLMYSTKNLLAEAENLFGCSREEILYVGRHPLRDVSSALEDGFSAVLLDRRSRYRGCACRRVRSLIELLPQIEKELENRQ